MRLRAARRPSPSRRPGPRSPVRTARSAPPSSTVMPASLQLADRLEHDAASLRVEPHRRLVHQHDPWVEHHGPRDLDDLLLAARERARARPATLAHEREALRHLLGPSRARRPVRAARSRPSARCPRRSSAGTGSAPAARARSRDRARRAASRPRSPAVERDRAPARAEQPAHHPQHGRLAGAVRSDHAGDRSRARPRGRRRAGCRPGRSRRRRPRS